jgi:DNA polymerase III subunit delta
VYLIAGPELLLVEEACDAIRAAPAREDNVDERVVLDADARFDWNQLGATGDTMSLFASRRLIEAAPAFGQARTRRRLERCATGSKAAVTMCC